MDRFPYLRILGFEADYLQLGLNGKQRMPDRVGFFQLCSDQHEVPELPATVTPATETPVTETPTTE